MIIECIGASIGSAWIGPFELARGDHRSVAWRKAYSSLHVDQREFLSALRCERAIPGFFVASPFRIVDPFSLVQRRTLSYNLAGNMLKEIQQFERDYQISGGMKIHALGATQRLLVALEKERFHHQNICYELSGLDPLGVEMTREYVRHKLCQHTVLEIILPTKNVFPGFYPQFTVDIAVPATT